MAASSPSTFSAKGVTPSGWLAAAPTCRPAGWEPAPVDLLKGPGGCRLQSCGAGRRGEEPRRRELESLLHRQGHGGDTVHPAADGHGDAREGEPIGLQREGPGPHDHQHHRRRRLRRLQRLVEEPPGAQVEEAAVGAVVPRLDAEALLQHLRVHREVPAAVSNGHDAARRRTGAGEPLHLVATVRPSNVRSLTGERRMAAALTPRTTTAVRASISPKALAPVTCSCSPASRSMPAIRTGSRRTRRARGRRRRASRE